MHWCETASVESEPDWKNRLKQVKNLNDQIQLKNIALEDPISTVRYHAVEKISDPSFLKQIALNDPNADIRKLAVSRINNESILVEVATHSPDWWLRKLATSKITSSHYLGRIAKTDKNKYVKLEAIRPINDQQILMDLFVSEQNEECIATILPKLTPDSLLTLRFLVPHSKQPYLTRQLKKINA